MLRFDWTRSWANTSGPALGRRLHLTSGGLLQSVWFCDFCSETKKEAVIFKIKTPEVLLFLFPLNLVTSKDFGILFWFFSAVKIFLCPAKKYQQHWHSFKFSLIYFPNTQFPLRMLKILNMYCSKNLLQFLSGIEIPAVI